VKTILLVPVVCAAVATMLCFGQGGFGGGHGKFDFVIYCLGLPATYFVAHGWLALPNVIEEQVLLSIIWIPAILNVLAVWLPIAVILRLVTPKK